MEKKKQLGQFFTSNYKYILQTFEIKDEHDITEPFAGNLDLINFIFTVSDEKFSEDDIIFKIKNTQKYKFSLYDIDPKNKLCEKRDTLIDPPNYNNKFIITNPPYLARNKSKNKDIYIKYDCDDLYKCFIKNICINTCNGGIIIIPLNFISSIRKKDIELRKNFIEVYNIEKINIFEEQVFSDTKYSVCSILFYNKNKSNASTDNIIKCNIFPSKNKINFKLNKKNNYSCGGEIYKLPKTSKYNIERATKKTNNKNITNLLIKCIDDNINSIINMSYVSKNKIFIDNTKNLSARSYISLIIEPTINEETQKKLCNDFNTYLNDKRKQYNSLFLTNYRESNTIARKRISFDLIYKICHTLLKLYDM